MPRVNFGHLSARREQILGGAQGCFSRYGYEGATVRRLEDSTGLVQVMRDVLTEAGAPGGGLSWLGARLEVSRRLRTDPGFRAEWEDQAGELTRAVRQRLIRQQEAGVVRSDPPVDVLASYLELSFEGLISHLAKGRPAGELRAVLDVVEASVRS